MKKSLVSLTVQLVGQSMRKSKIIILFNCDEYGYSNKNTVAYYFK